MIIFFLFFRFLLFYFPVTLILKQPDLGTAAIIISVSFIIFFIAGLSWKLFVSIGFLLLMIAPYIWSLLQNYQKQRILTLYNPENDPLGSGYHIIQSQIAVGSGGTLGKGG